MKANSTVSLARKTDRAGKAAVWCAVAAGCGTVLWQILHADKTGYEDFADYYGLGFLAVQSGVIIGVVTGLIIYSIGTFFWRK